MVFKPSLGLFAAMLGVIVLLEDDIIYRMTIMVEAGLKVLLQNLDVKVPIHLSINPASIPNSIPQHASSHHQRSPSKLQSPFNQPIIQVLSRLFPHPFPPI